MKNKVFVLFAIVFLIHLFFRIYQYNDFYLDKFDGKYWEKRYEMSQWSTKPACKDPDPHINPYTCEWDDNWEADNKYIDQTLIKKNDLGDDGLYGYAAWEYINGRDPTTLNAETPPFGKYIIGLFIVLFGNQNLFALFSGILTLIAFYLMNKTIVQSRVIAFIPVALFSLEPLFYTQLKAPLLDLLYLSLLFITFYFILKKKFIFSSVSLGLMAATKSSLTTFVLVGATIMCYLLVKRLRKNKTDRRYSEIKAFLLSLPIAFVVFLTTYIVYFLNGNSIRQFLGVQKWIVNFYTIGAKGNITALWQMFFTGKWDTWFGSMMSVSEWHVGWIALLIVTALEIYLCIKKRIMDKKALLIIWIVFYLIFLSFVPIWPRYLLVVLPFMYNLFIWRLIKIITGTTSIKGN